MGIERHLVNALQLLSELFEEALARTLDELDDLDQDVVIDQVDDAGRHVTSALFALRPDLERLAPERRVAHLERLFARYPVEVIEESVWGYASAAWDELSELLGSRNARIREEADFAMSHLDVVLLLVDPDMYSRAIEDASAADRVRLAAQAEAAELMLEEARELVKRIGV